MKLLDLFCGHGGSAKGYELAGFDTIVGVDNRRIDNYPYSFVWEDAIDYLYNNDISRFDLIHASPPCQKYSLGTRTRNREKYDCYIEELREFFNRNDIHYVIENVIAAPLVDPIILEGNMFGLPLVRRRLFETNWPCHQPEIRFFKKSQRSFVTLAGNGGHANSYSLYHWMQATGIWWMRNRAELSQAIPPKYTKYIGESFFHYYYNELHQLGESYVD